ncbi:MAG: cation:dicarboxylase symporter family transporter [Blautia sp.]|nr:cation:dicarboxylase symporter family transporter [Blautia sp.]
MGETGILGSGLICLSVLLTQMGVLVEAVGLVMGIDPFIGMFRCMNHCLGNVAVTAILAKNEKMIDEDAFTK